MITFWIDVCKKVGILFLKITLLWMFSINKNKKWVFFEETQIKKANSLS